MYVYQLPKERFPIPLSDSSSVNLPMSPFYRLLFSLTFLLTLQRPFVSFAPPAIYPFRSVELLVCGLLVALASLMVIRLWMPSVY